MNTVEQWSGVLEEIEKLPKMTDQEFRNAVSVYVTNAAVMNSRGGCPENERMIEACVAESSRRHIAAGHDADCRETDLYQKGWNDAYRSQGYAADPITPCTCKRRQ